MGAEKEIKRGLRDAEVVLKTFFLIYPQVFPGVSAFSVDPAKSAFNTGRPLIGMSGGGAFCAGVRCRSWWGMFQIMFCFNSF